MRFTVQETQAGKTVFDQQAGECFKSRHSAWDEADQVFYRPGIAENPWFGEAKPFKVLELGFGLGTNFLFLQDKPVHLVSLDRDLSGARFFLEQEPNESLETIVSQKKFIRDSFKGELWEIDFTEALPKLLAQKQQFHCIYFDPFSPKANPEAWRLQMFSWAAALLHPGGRLVTYSVSRIAKEGAKAAGLEVQKRDLPSALHKRSSLLAIKPREPLE